MSTRIWDKLDARSFLAMVLVFAFMAGPMAAAGTIPADVAAAMNAGSVVPIAHWKIQSSAKAQEGGKVISERGFSTKGWYPVSAHVTVMAGLLENGKYPNIFYETNLRGVGDPHGRLAFAVPWWYRSTFHIPDSRTDLHTFIKINGIISNADIWLNGREIVSHHGIVGTYITREIDVTQLVHTGTNVLAVRVYPANPERNFIQGWIDWNPHPPDNNMGIWRNVDIVRSGPVSLHDLHVLSKLKLPGLGTARLTVKVKVRNDTDATQNAVVSGHVAGVSLDRRVRLAPGQTQTLVFDPSTNAALKLAHPKVWWPVGMGAHPLYHVKLTATVGGAVSDRSQATFGIRSVTSHLTKQGYRQFVINGKPLLIRGGGWAPDMFLRDQPKRLATEFRYVQNLGLNAIRSEGKLERPDFYRLADRDGILILPGWECCDKWESQAKTGGAPWDTHDMKIADASMASEARRLRDHPSVIAFLIGSDDPPPPKVAKMYIKALHAADWPDPIISAASTRSYKSQLPEPSGIRMSGPYGWVPPDYWYADKVGGGFGFVAETSAGADVPRLPTLRAMMTPRALQALWQDPDAKQYHASPAWSPFSTLKLFDVALAHTYGKPTSLADYVEKAQLANYAGVRAQFEAYDAHMDAANPSTGVIYWMLNNAWPSLHWHLMNHYLNPNGAYFGAKMANQPVHIQYSYNNRAVMAINHTLQPVRHLDARIRVFNLGGKVQYSRRLTGIDLAGNHATRLAVIPALKDLSSTYFVELELTEPDGQPVSRNVYWLSNKPAQLDWAKSNWYTTPVTRYANLTALQKLPTVDVKANAHTRRNGNHRVTTVTVTAPRTNKDVAFFVHLSLRQAAKGKPVVPIVWSGNDVSLWPGESATLTARYQATGKVAPVVRASGWNVNPRSIPVSAYQQKK